MFVKAVSVVVLLCLLENIEANKCPRCGGKVRLRALFEEDDPIFAKCLGQSLIRPKAIQKPTLNIPLYGSSFKGPCFRKTAIVKPAVIPRPIYIQPDCKPGIGTSDSELATAAAVAAEMLTQLSKSNCLSSAPVNLGPSIDVSKAYKQALAGTQSSVPADAVSLALAYKIYQDSFNHKVNEDGLTYGFRKLPIEKPKPAKPSTSSISEASLYSLNGPIVELKPPPEEISADSLSAEAMDELVDLAGDTEVNNVNFVKRPSLMDLGYTPAQTRREEFFNIDPLTLSSTNEPTFVEESESPTSLDTSSQALSETSDSTESTSVVTDPALTLPSPETPSVESISADPIPAPVYEEREGTEEQGNPEPIVSSVLTKGFKPGDVIYKDFATSDLKDDALSTGVNCESQEEVVTHIPVPAPQCGCLIDDHLEGIRTYSRS